MCSGTDEVVDSLLMYLVKNSDGPVSFAFSQYEILHPLRKGQNRPRFHLYLKALPQNMPPAYRTQNVTDEDYAILKNGLSNTVQGSRQCFLHGNVVSCLWNKDTNLPFLPTNPFPTTHINMATRGRSGAPQYVALDFEDGAPYFALPSCFFRLNFTSDINELPLVYFRWIGAPQRAHQG